MTELVTKLVLVSDTTVISVVGTEPFDDVQGSARQEVLLRELYLPWMPAPCKACVTTQIPAARGVPQ